MAAIIQRNVIVAPFSVKTPLLTPRSDSKKANADGSGVALPHVNWFQSVAAGVNASPQITGVVPANSASKGEPGTIAFDANWLYICVGLNIWRRVALSAF